MRMNYNAKTYLKLSVKQVCYFTILYLFVLLPVWLFSQERISSLPYVHKIRINPAFAGLSTIQGWAMGLSHSSSRIVEPQNQFGIQDIISSNVFACNLDKGFRNRLASGGINLFAGTEALNEYRRTDYNFTFGYNVPLGKRLRYHHLRAGFQGGITQITLGRTGMTFEDQFTGRSFSGNTTESTVELNQIVPDISAGILFYKLQKIRGNPELNYFCGAAMYHMNRPHIEFQTSGVSGMDTRNIITLVNMGVNYRSRKPFDLNISGIISLLQKNPAFNIQGFGRYTFYENEPFFGKEILAVSLGANYAHQNYLAPFISVDIRNYVAIGFSYSFITNMTFLPDNLGGGNISILVYLNKIKPKILNPEEDSAPDFDLPFPNF